MTVADKIGNLRNIFTAVGGRLSGILVNIDAVCASVRSKSTLLFSLFFKLFIKLSYFNLVEIFI